MRKFDFLVTCCEGNIDLLGVLYVSLDEEVSDELRTCYEEVARKLLPWNLALH